MCLAYNYRKSYCCAVAGAAISVIILHIAYLQSNWLMAHGDKNMKLDDRCGLLLLFNDLYLTII